MLDENGRKVLVGVLPDRDAYFPGQIIHAVLRISNPTGGPLEVWRPPSPHDLNLYIAPGPRELPCNCSVPKIDSITLGPQEEWTLRTEDYWYPAQIQAPVTPGNYKLIYSYQDTSADFRVVPGEPVLLYVRRIEPSRAEVVGARFNSNRCGGLREIQLDGKPSEVVSFSPSPSESWFRAIVKAPGNSTRGVRLQCGGQASDSLTLDPP